MKNMKKLLLIIIFAAFLFIVLYIPASAAGKDKETQEIYSRQLSVTGADKLYDSLPADIREKLRNNDIRGFKTDADMGRIFISLIRNTVFSSGTVMKAFTACIAIMLICALFHSTGLVSAGASLSRICAAAASAGICLAAALPAGELIGRCIELINGASGVLLLYIPVMTGLMVSSGCENAAASYYSVLMFTGNLVSRIASGLLAPMMNVFLALSVTSSISGKLRFSSFCDAVYKSVKWILMLLMGIFTAALSGGTLASSSLDRISHRTLRYVVGSFVPIVGNVLGETLGAFSGSLELLRSGAGVFVIIVSGCLFLPLLTECLIWRISLSLLSGISDILGERDIKPVFSAISTAIAMITAVMMCMLTIFIISSVTLLLSGGGG